jgi:hypothetical protein
MRDEGRRASLTSMDTDSWSHTLSFLHYDSVVVMMHLCKRVDYRKEALHTLVGRTWSFRQAKAFCFLHPDDALLLKHMRVSNMSELNEMTLTYQSCFPNVKHIDIDIRERCHHVSAELIDIMSLPVNLTSLSTSIGWNDYAGDLFPYHLRHLCVRNRLHQLMPLELSGLPDKMQTFKSIGYELQGFLPDHLLHLDVETLSMTQWLSIEHLPVGLHTLKLKSPAANVPEPAIWKQFTQLLTLDLTLNWSHECRIYGYDPLPFMSCADVPRTVTALHHVTFAANDLLQHLPPGLITLNLMGYAQSAWAHGALPCALRRLELDINKPLTLTEGMLPASLTSLYISTATTITVRSLPPMLDQLVHGVLPSDVMTRSTYSEHTH